jgi:hypothetical protein
MKGEFASKTESFYEMFESSWCIDYNKLLYQSLPLTTPYSIELGAGDGSFTCESVVGQWTVPSNGELSDRYPEQLTQLSYIATELKNPKETEFPVFETNMNRINMYNERLEQSGQKNRLYYIYNADIRSLHTNWLQITDNHRPFEVTCINPWYYYNRDYQPVRAHTTDLVANTVKFADYI